MRRIELSHASETAVSKIETDIKRRLFLGGMVGAGFAFSSTPLRAQISASVE